MTWKAINPAWPDQPIKLYGAGSDSGTFDYFTEAVVGKAKSSRGDYTASEDDNTLVKGVATDKNALGYVPFSYYEENKKTLKIVPVVSPKTKLAVTPSRATVENGTYMPLARPLFIYVNEASYKKPEVKDFTKFYLTKAAQLSVEVKQIPLPAKVYAMTIEHVSKGKLGTAFNGHSEVGMKIEDLLKKEKTL
jgi:phosphate transport system substrate-binding protein